jgi:uncharacterized protein YifE (UPF0438 family)
MQAKIIAALIVLGALLGLHYYDKEQALSSIRSEYTLKSKEIITRTERATQALEASTRKSIKDKENELQNVVANRDAALLRLQHRAVRPSVITVTEVRETCTGRSLFREDAEFLTREASRADKILIERDFYYDKYEEARLKLEELHNGTSRLP